MSRLAFLRSEAAWLLRRPTAPGGRWDDKFITLTVPHSGDPAKDARELAAAYKRFRRMFCLWLQHALGVPKQLLRFPYVRVQEITPSDGGHAHYHLWAFLPFVPQAVLSALWGRALSNSYRAKLPSADVATLLSGQTDPRSRKLMERTFVTRRGSCGRTLDSVPMAIVDVRAGRNAEHELIKYLVKDAVRDPSGKLKFIPADVFAELYAALEGRRVIQTSTGFWVHPPAVEKSCEECGLVHGAGQRPTCKIVAVEPVAVERAS